LIDGFFNLEPFPNPFDLDKFFRSCAVYYHLLRNDPEREFPKILEIKSSGFHAYSGYATLIY